MLILHSFFFFLLVFFSVVLFCFNNLLLFSNWISTFYLELFAHFLVGQQNPTVLVAHNNRTWCQQCSGHGFDSHVTNVAYWQNVYFASISLRVALLSAKQVHIDFIYLFLVFILFHSYLSSSSIIFNSDSKLTALRHNFFFCGAVDCRFALICIIFLCFPSKHIHLVAAERGHKRTDSKKEKISASKAFAASLVSSLWCLPCMSSWEMNFYT